MGLSQRLLRAVEAQLASRTERLAAIFAETHSAAPWRTGSVMAHSPGYIQYIRHMYPSYIFNIYIYIYVYIHINKQVFTIE